MGKKEFVEVKYSSLTSMFLSANGFYTNYENLKQKEVEEIGILKDYDLSSVAATSGFFSVELYLKLIYAIIYWENNERNKKNPDNSTKFPTGHNIKKLYENLDDNSKKMINKELLNVMNEKQLLEKLDKYKEGFIEWRYSL